jgi:hypothetical protein
MVVAMQRSGHETVELHRDSGKEDAHMPGCRTFLSQRCKVVRSPGHQQRDFISDFWQFSLNVLVQEPLQKLS